MALSFVINKIVRQRAWQRVLAGEMDEEKRLEEELEENARAQFDDGQSSSSDNRSQHDSIRRKKRAIRYVQPPVLSPLPKIYFSRLERYSIKVSWAKLTNPVQSRWKWTQNLLERAFDRFFEEECYKRVYLSMMTATAAGVESQKTKRSSCRAHAKQFYEMLGEFVNAIKTTPLSMGYCVPSVTSIAEAHIPLQRHGFKAEFFDRLGELIIDTFLMEEVVLGCPYGRKERQMSHCFQLSETQRRQARHLRKHRKDTWVI